MQAGQSVADFTPHETSQQSKHDLRTTLEDQTKERKITAFRVHHSKRYTKKKVGVSNGKKVVFLLCANDL